ncbi:MAG: hypothetical protein U0T11_03445 [Chitinophagaceae bacterium]
MKKLVAAVVLILFVFAAQAQDDKGFKRENIFIGSGINLGFSNGFILGLNPEIGYSLNKFVDAGLATNITYITQNDYNSSAVFRYSVAGGGPFIRFWPARMLFIGGQLEYNTISSSVKFEGNVTDKTSYSAPSILVGAGYGNRFIGQSQFYTSIVVDVMKDQKSPYVDGYNRMQPVFRTAFLFYLHPKKESRQK